jgi:Uma2 family endonuclease
LTPHPLVGLDSAAFERFVDLPENAGRHFELLGGKVYEMASPTFLHNWIALKLARFIDEYLDAHPIGYVAHEVDHVLGEQDVLRPDVHFMRRGRLASLDVRPRLAPDLAVEILSPSNSEPAIGAKIRAYLEHGTELVWVLDPTTRTAWAHWRGAGGDIISETVTELDGREVLPAFRLAVGRLFPPDEGQERGA